jgi:hypothetical protein
VKSNDTIAKQNVEFWFDEANYHNPPNYQIHHFFTQEDSISKNFENIDDLIKDRLKCILYV